MLSSPRGLPRLQVKIPSSPIGQATLTARPFRKAMYILWILIVTLLLLVRKLNAFSLAGKTGAAKGEVIPSSHQRWVGGGAVLSSTDDRRESEDSQQPLSGDDGELFSQDNPEVLWIPLEQAVHDVQLDGWEDEWFSAGQYDAQKSGLLSEPKIDFVYNWVNGSEDAFQQIRRQYELVSPLNDREGKWISQHSINRYRDWDELRYSLRSLDAYASFVNNIQILVNSVNVSSSSNSTKTPTRPQRPTWLKHDPEIKSHVQVLSQESFFSPETRSCLPTFNSLSIESQLHLTPSDTTHLIALSDDMFLGTEHSPSDFFSPLFGPMQAFKADSYNIQSLGPPSSWPSFGEKPFLYYTSHLLNRRFGARARHAQAHMPHSVSRAVLAETMAAFPGPAAEGACARFRGEAGQAQLYPWFAAFHYAIERFREALLWGFIFSRIDADGDGHLNLAERQGLLAALEKGRRAFSGGDVGAPVKRSKNRDRMYYRLPEELARAGLQPPKVNVNVLWTALDGPATLRSARCSKFNVDRCLGEGFASPAADVDEGNPDFAASNVFARLTSQHAECGDCVLKFALDVAARGLEPVLPPKEKAQEREVVIKALKKYQHTVVDSDAMKFVMVKDAEQAETELLERTIRRGKVYGQWCLNDDVMSEKVEEVERVRTVIDEMFETLWPTPGKWEKDGRQSS